ncbi:hypothetical protein SAMD00019534_102280 [Acytostelium subglobosum LB1]|uniref:hypothetical protein n=1 Tax=Acytostelium subglobosum LB1 TaxID=1410327 RepID=UPI00064486A0|nr:hypothetical protein SAMD00019534_102280 [Acytostelium subglobosum LB1]GAM27053.1 hypothetical protein SAMD00019534_102280 [Acytostelium subglobosum LB1]|eukprot:XP_012749933.1 hypothetical protein SAMD00019534_102280 [Acytostelium subglobosum LB1]
MPVEITTKTSSQPQPSLLNLYRLWQSIWLSRPDVITNYTYTNSQTKNDNIMSVEELSKQLRQDTPHNLQMLDHKHWENVVDSLCHHLQTGQLSIGPSAPTCPDTDLVGPYNPRTGKCTCKWDSIPNDPSISDIQVHSGCTAIKKVLDSLESVASRDNEWLTDIFTVDDLRVAVDEVLLSNTDIQPAPTTCQGAITNTVALPIEAPNCKC